MRLLLIRHGETLSNAEGRLQGHLDVPLSERGVRESELLGERLAGLAIAALYTSPLSRARTTAEVIATRLGLSTRERPALMERNLGELAGLTGAEVRELFPEYMRARREAPAEIAVPGYEKDGDFKERVLLGVEEIIRDHAEQTVVAVSHGGVIAAFCRQTLSMPVVRPGVFDIANASISTFDVLDGEFDGRVRARVRLVSLNDTCHLDGLRP